MLESRPEQHGTEEQEGCRVEQRPRLLGEPHHRRDIAGDEQTEQPARRERGDESRPAESLCDTEREHSGCHRDDLPPCIIDQASLARRDHDPRGKCPGDDASEEPVADLFADHLRWVGRPPRAGCRRENDQQDRDADPVVQPALDVERLPHPLRKARVRHDRAAESGIGRREDHTEDQSLT